VVGKRPTYEVSDPARARDKTVFTESARGANSRQVKSVRVVGDIGEPNHMVRMDAEDHDEVVRVVRLM
jgi:hypothetical protein